MNLRDFIQQDTPKVKESKRKSLAPAVKKLSIIDILKAATIDKIELDFSDEGVQKSYDQYMVNRWLSMDDSLIFLAEMLTSTHNLTNEQHFDMIQSALPQEKFYIKYIKRQKDLTEKDKRYIAHYFEISLREADDYIKQMDEDELYRIIDTYRYGKDEMIQI